MLPETERWGIDALAPLVDAEAPLGWAPDPMLRVMAVVPPDAERMGAMADRLHLSNAERERLTAWARTSPVMADTDETSLARRLYTKAPPPSSTACGSPWPLPARGRRARTGR